MVQVIQRSPSFTQSLSQGLSETLQTSAKQQYQRGLVKESMKELQGLSDKVRAGEATPFDLASALISSTAGIPGSERYVGQLFDILTKQTQLGQRAGIGLPGQGNSPMGQGFQGNQSGNQNQNSQPIQQNSQQQNQLPQWIPPPSGNALQGAVEPTSLGMGPIPKIYTPEDIASIEREAASRGIDAAPIIKQLDDYNTRSRDQIGDYVKGAETQATIGKLRSDAQERFRGVLQNELQSGGRRLNEDDLSVAERISERPDIIKISNEKIRAEKAKKIFDQYEEAKNNFTKSSERFNFNAEERKRQINNLRTTGKLMEDFGQRNQAIRILQENGWGRGEVDEILNPLPEDVKSGFNKLPKMENILKRIQTLPDQEGFEQEFIKSSDVRNKELQKYIDYLSKVIKPGSEDQANVIAPGTSLLLLQKEFIDKGGTWQEYADILRNLIQNEKIELDPVQSGQLELLNKDPSLNLGFWEAVLKTVPGYSPRY